MVINTKQNLHLAKYCVFKMCYVFMYCLLKSYKNHIPYKFQIKQTLASSVALDVFLFSGEILEMDVICGGHNLLKKVEVLVIRLQREPKGHQYDDDQ